MFSLQKILALVAIIAAVWYGFKLITRLDQARKDKQAGGVGSDTSSVNQQNQQTSSAKIEDLVECKTCGSFVAAGSKPDCGQGDACPFA